MVFSQAAPKIATFTLYSMSPLLPIAAPGHFRHLGCKTQIAKNPVSQDLLRLGAPLETQLQVCSYEQTLVFALSTVNMHSDDTNE